MIKIAVFVLIAAQILGLGAPVATYAQEVSTTTSNTSSDGSTEPTEERRERIRSWRRQSSEIEQKINTLSSEVVTSLPVPILFGVALRNIFPNFGDPRGGGTRTHEGEDIMGVKGTPIVSPTPAIVLRTGTGETEGLYVYTANPGGETFVYMHLDKIGEGVTPGATLETGSLIGYVGNTGNASGGAAHLHFEIFTGSRNHLDPYPRLSREFTPQEKINYLSKILTQTTDPAGLSIFLVTNFRSTFTGAQGLGITLPQAIVDALGTTPVSGTATTRTATSATVLPAGDLDLESRGAQVIELQKYLILKATGAEAVKLKAAGATGYFGPLTQSALREFQMAMNILPANGYYGPKTRAVVLASSSVTPSTSAPSVSVGVNLTRNLYKGLVGEDVRSLQKFLNAQGHVIATSGSGSVGNETTYFGSATESAVIKFQIAQKISPSVGYVGLVTRTQIKKLSGI